MTASARPFALAPGPPVSRRSARRATSPASSTRSVAELPILSPHGHTDPQWFADDAPFPDPARLFIVPDHYVHRMLYSQGVRPEEVGVPRRRRRPGRDRSRARSGGASPRTFICSAARRRGCGSTTPSPKCSASTSACRPTTPTGPTTTSPACLERPEFRPRALFERFNIEALTTTESPLDDARAITARSRQSGWSGRVLTAFRPDPVVDPGFPRLSSTISPRSAASPTPTSRPCNGYLARARRAARLFQVGRLHLDRPRPSDRAHGRSCRRAKRRRSIDRVRGGGASAADAELFRAQMLTEMARMSLDDGLVDADPSRLRSATTIRGSSRRSAGTRAADIPTPTDYVRALKPLLDRFGNERELTIILFTLDETAYSRELAPLAGHYPALKLGPAWWFFDSPEGMRRFRESRHRDRRLLQHRRLQRRHPRLPVDPGAPRHEPARRLRLSRPPRRRSIGSSSTRPRGRARSRLSAGEGGLQAVRRPMDARAAVIAEDSEAMRRSADGHGAAARPSAFAAVRSQGRSGV